MRKILKPLLRKFRIAQLSVLTIALAGCGGGGGGSSSPQISLGYTTIRGTYSYATPSVASSKNLSVSRAIKALAYEDSSFSAKAYTIDGYLLGTGKVFSDRSFLINISNDKLSGTQSSNLKNSIIVVQNSTDTSTLKRITPQLSYNATNQLNVNLTTLSQVKSLEREVSRLKKVEDPSFDARNFVLGTEQNSLSSASDSRNQEISPLFNENNRRINPEAFLALEDRDGAPLTPLLRVAYELYNKRTTVQQTVGNSQAFEEAFNDILHCSIENTSCTWTQLSNDVFNTIGGKSQVRKATEYIKLQNEKTLISEKLNGLTVSEQLTNSYNQSQTKLQALLELNWTNAYSFRIAKFQEILNRSMQSYLAKVYAGADSAKLYSMTSSTANYILNLPDSPYEQKVDDTRTQMVTDLVNNGPTLNEITQLTIDGLNTTQPVGENLAIVYLGIATLARDLPSVHQQNIMTYSTEAIKTVLLTLEQNATNGSEKKKKLVEEIIGISGNDYSTPTSDKGLATPPVLTLSAPFTTALTQEAFLRYEIPIHFHLEKSMPYFNAQVNIEYSIDNGTSFHPISLTTNSPTLTSLQSPGDHSVIWNSLKDTGAVSRTAVIRLTPSDDFGTGSPVSTPYFKLYNNTLPDLSAINSPIYYMDGSNQKITTFNIPETLPDKTRVTVFLDATGTTDSDEQTNTLKFLWSSPNTPAVTINNSTSMLASFSTPDIQQTTNLPIQLSVTDSDGGISIRSYTVQLLFENISPIASIKGSDVVTQVSIGDTITLDGGASYDPDGKPLATYEWLSAMPAYITTSSIANRGTATATYTIPNTPYFQQGNQLATFTLRITDADGLTDQKQISFKVDFNDHDPVANAGTDFSIGDNLPYFELQGNATDADNQPIQLVWTFPSVNYNIGVSQPTSTPAFGTATDRIRIATPTDISPNEKKRVFSFQLNATALERDADGNLTGQTTGVTATDIVTVTVFFVNDQAPVVSAGPRNVTTSESIDGRTHQTFTLDASDTCLPYNGSCDPASTASLSLTYQWQQVFGPSVSLSSTTSRKAEFTLPNVPPEQTTTLDFVLTVTSPAPPDTSQPEMVSSTMKSIVVSYLNFWPTTVDAGNIQTANEQTDSGTPATITLSGTAVDPDISDGQQLSYTWEQISPSLPKLTLNDANSLKSTFISPNVTADTDFIFRFTVLDGSPTDAQKRTTATALHDETTVRILYINTPPIANAGTDISLSEGASFTLTGTGFDAETTGTLRYEWLELPALTTVASGTSSTTNTLYYTTTAPADVLRSDGYKYTDYIFRVCDEDSANTSGKGILCTSDTVRITRFFLNQAPVANIIEPSSLTVQENNRDNPIGKDNVYSLSFFANPTDPDIGDKIVSHQWTTLRNGSEDGGTFYTEMEKITSTAGSPLATEIKVYPKDVCEDLTAEIQLMAKDESNTWSQPSTSTFTIKFVNRPIVFEESLSATVSATSPNIIHFSTKVSDGDLVDPVRSCTSGNTTTSTTQTLYFRWSLVQADLNSKVSNMEWGCFIIPGAAADQSAPNKSCILSQHSEYSYYDSNFTPGTSSRSNEISFYTTKTTADLLNTGIYVRLDVSDRPDNVSWKQSNSANIRLHKDSFTYTASKASVDTNNAHKIFPSTGYLNTARFLKEGDSILYKQRPLATAKNLMTHTPSEYATVKTSNGSVFALDYKPSVEIPAYKPLTSITAVEQGMLGINTDGILLLTDDFTINPVLMHRFIDPVIRKTGEGIFILDQQTVYRFQDSQLYPILSGANSIEEYENNLYLLYENGTVSRLSGDILELEGETGKNFIRTNDSLFVQTNTNSVYQIENSTSLSYFNNYPEASKLQACNDNLWLTTDENQTYLYDRDTKLFSLPESKSTLKCITRNDQYYIQTDETLSIYNSTTGKVLSETLEANAPILSTRFAKASILSGQKAWTSQGYSIVSPWSNDYFHPSSEIHQIRRAGEGIAIFHGNQVDLYTHLGVTRIFSQIPEHCNLSSDQLGWFMQCNNLIIRTDGSSTILPIPDSQYTAVTYQEKVYLQKDNSLFECNSEQTNCTYTSIPAYLALESADKQSAILRNNQKLFRATAKSLTEIGTELETVHNSDGVYSLTENPDILLLDQECSILHNDAAIHYHCSDYSRELATFNSGEQIHQIITDFNHISIVTDRGISVIPVE
jgi:hypothetical protein